VTSARRNALEIEKRREAEPMETPRVAHRAEGVVAGSTRVRTAVRLPSGSAEATVVCSPTGAVEEAVRSELCPKPHDTPSIEHCEPRIFLTTWHSAAGAARTPTFRTAWAIARGARQLQCPVSQRRVTDPWRLANCT